jgi:hypothetical protein
MQPCLLLDNLLELVLLKQSLFLPKQRKLEFPLQACTLRLLARLSTAHIRFSKLDELRGLRDVPFFEMWLSPQRRAHSI